jgi:hypothetical protein
MKRSLIVIVLLLSMAINLHAQLLSAKLQAYQKTFPIEKIYLSFDKPYYNVGDTIWFKSFLLNADFSASNRSDKIYIELFNDSLKFIENRVTLLNNGLGCGDIELKPGLKEGTYTIRAYSNWQQNLGEEYFYQKSFYVGKASNKTWLLDSYQKLTTSETKKTLDLKVRITTINNQPVALKSVEVYLMNDKKRVMRANLQTTIDGKIETSIPLGSTNLTGNYSFVIVDKNDKNQNAVLAISLQETNEVDLQFMPEGGYLVNGIYGKIGFKAIGADGMGRNVSGNIVNSKNETIVAFNTIHKGMGNFFLLPQKGETYATVININGKETRKPLPIAKDEGTTLRIDPLSIRDSVIIFVKATEMKRMDGYLLSAQVTGETLMEVNINLKNGFSILKVPKKDFPNGIIHFTLFSPESLPLNERQVMINYPQKIQLKITSDKNSYTPRDSISLEIIATKENGLPLSGSFSIAVTDENQVKQDQYQGNITSYFLLQSEIKGNIEDPAWYFYDQDATKLLALDQLMLAQGWIGYKWDNIIKSDLLPRFKAEKGNLIEGKLTNLLNKPVPNVNLTLLSLGKNIFLTDTISNSEGKFTFKDVPLFDTVAYSIKIKNAKGKTSTATIMVDEFIPPKDITTIDSAIPWYNNPDSTLLNYYTTVVKKEKEPKLSLSGTTLKEVEIKGQKKLKDFIQTTAWDSKFIMEINEEELKKNPRKSLFDLIKEKIPGFRADIFWAHMCGKRPGAHRFTNYVIGNMLVSHIMIDKINTHLVASGIDDEYNGNIDGVSSTASDSEIFETNKYILNRLSAEDVINITLYRGCVYYFLDITTRSGKGPWITNTPGMYVFRPLPVYRAKDFYSPKYTAAKSGALPDLRSTIFWDANVVTDEKGKALVSFYAADLPSTYLIKIEGTDLLGRFGTETKKINILPPKTNP